jgi:hypothetical protein
MMFICKQCETVFKPNKMKEQTFCSISCLRESWKKPTKFCKNCSSEITSKWANAFCGRSCSVSYANKHKAAGTVRSKLEEHVERELHHRLSKELLFNDKSVIGSELDIYDPEKKIAIELNGLLHYAPIYGEEKLSKIIKNDKEKVTKCEELGIRLVVIDTREQNKFSIASSEIYVNMILELLT